MNSQMLPRIVWPRLMLIIATAFLVLQTAVFIGQLIGAWVSHHQANDKAYERILLDSFYLDVGNEKLSTSVNEKALRQYIHNLNAVLTQQQLPVRVLAIQGIKGAEEISADYNSVLTKSFVAAEQEVTINLANLPWYSYLAFSPTSALVAFLLGICSYQPHRHEKHVSKIKKTTKPLAPKLIINLKDKTLMNNVDSKAVNLQNKPFCFYAALVQYCIQHPHSSLSPHQDIPAELTVLCNKIFSRLVELGHTKRKRPDFNANLEKTLSEIRSAVDELFFDYPAEKEKFYPPRAQGEGSRSKQHSFGLRGLKLTDIEITHT
ncbi:hypothetical protein OPS25_14355 [Alteromonas ponticola]|uniref:Uncharacterized protein n=1 Tax=Alteromonas aquimaris TaxID=2998417 RepID=A0ABT3PA79_9ALTE|nr:hypothetical protein [Alteromonas aquimaris]MCW8109689.1 hypothetical protein [Alteromonas aquimaris]